LAHPHNVVLLGLGHTHAEIVRRWRDRPIDGAALTCVSDFAVSTYSGMLPGVLAGQYRPSQMQIDLARLCASAGARLVIGEGRGLDRGARMLRVAGQAPLPFDVLSIGIGSVPALDGVMVADDTMLVPTKPMPSFLDRLGTALGRASVRRRGASIRIAVVGGGAGGAELALTLGGRPWALPGGEPRIERTLVTGPGGLAPGRLEATTGRVQRALERRGVRLLDGRLVVGVDESRVTLDDSTTLETDVVVWATGATAPPLLASLGLPTDARGFLLTSDTLRTTAGDPIFVVGDSGTLVASATPKAGIYAVRQAPVLWENIRRTLERKPLRAYRPQRGVLRLINTGDGRAIGEWRVVSFEGRWCWHLKDAIDRRFVRKYQVARAGRATGPATG
jgi:selenide, water dikinase